MSELATRAEVGRLANELDVPADELGFLLDLDAADLRQLRRGLAAGLDARHRSTFGAMARASKLLPAALLSPIAEKAIGPLLCSKIAAQLEPGHARKIVGQFSVAFLADLCRTLDTVEAGDVIGAIPARRAVAVGRELYRRRDHETLAMFIDAVADDVFEPMLAEIDDEGFLLEVAVAAESTSRLQLIIELLDDARIRSLLHAAASSSALPELVVLLGEIGPDQAERILVVAVDDGDVVVTDLVASISDIGGWDELLPVVAGLDPEVLSRLARSPAIARPELFRSVADDVLAHDLGEEVVTLVAAMPEAVQREVAATLAANAPEVAAELLALVDQVHGAAELPAVHALREAAA